MDDVNATPDTAAKPIRYVTFRDAGDFIQQAAALDRATVAIRVHPSPDGRAWVLEAVDASTATATTDTTAAARAAVSRNDSWPCPPFCD